MKFRLTNKPNRTLSRKGKGRLDIICRVCIQYMQHCEIPNSALPNRRRYACSQCRTAWSIPVAAFVIGKKTEDEAYFGKGAVSVAYKDDYMMVRKKYPSKVLELSLTVDGGVYSHLLVSDEVWNSVKVGQKYEIQID